MDAVTHSSGDGGGGNAHVPPISSTDLRIVLQDIIIQQWNPPPTQRPDAAPAELIAISDNVTLQGARLPTPVVSVEEIVAHNASGVRTRNRIALANIVQSGGTSGTVEIAEENNEIILVEDTQQHEVLPSLSVTTSSRKRKRTASKPPTSPKVSKTNENTIENDDDDDDSMTCPICLEFWEVSGDHRPVSLKCGHVFGQSCIKRWMQECPAAARCCPSCKKKANNRDIRQLYVKKLCGIDRSELNQIQAELDKEKMCNSKLRQDNALLRLELEMQRNLYNALSVQMETTKKNAINLSLSTLTDGELIRAKMYKLYRERTINICNEPGCRVLIHGRSINKLLVSQKSTQSLFPGFGVRFIDLPTFRPSQFLHMASRQVRDLSFDFDEELLAAASMDKVIKLYNVSSRQCVSQFMPSNSSIWSVAFDRSRTKAVYLGTQHGATYVYDIRQPNNFLSEHKAAGDMSPVINICSVTPVRPEFPFGGFLVCKLQSLWFYEYNSDEAVVATKFSLAGPFVSMSYNEQTQHILIATRPTAAQPSCRYVVADLRRIDDTVMLNVITTMLGSKVQAVMTRCSQISIDNTMIVAAYMQDTKLLQTWRVDVEKKHNLRMQSLPIEECVLDLCPIHINDENVCVGALSATKCRIFKINADDASGSTMRRV